MVSQLIGSFHTRNAALQAIEELAALGNDVEFVPVEHGGTRAAAVRVILRGAQGAFIGGAIGLAAVFIVPSEFLLPVAIICSAAGGLLNVRLTRPKPLPIAVEDTSVQVLVIVHGRDLDTARMVLQKEGVTAIQQIDSDTARPSGSAGA